MLFEKIQIETRGNVGTIRLNVPASLNAMSVAMLEEFDCAVDMMAASTRAIIVTGVGRAFCSGANLDGGMGNPSEMSDFGLVLERYVNPLMTKLRDLPIPWISAVRGAAAGVGCSLALAADLIVASETAYFLQAFARIGLVPDGGSSHLLSRATSRVRAMEMMLLGDKVPAAQALDWGLVNRIVPDDALEDTAFKLANRLAAGPTLTLSLIRRAAWTVLDADWGAGLQMERSLQKIAGQTHDAREGIAAFLEKRPASFTGS